MTGKEGGNAMVIDTFCAWLEFVGRSIFEQSFTTCPTATLFLLSIFKVL
jgi:hypothetical protein